MVRAIALLVSFGVGFLSLSQEIVWVRILGFSQQGRPQAFSLVLVAFLAGIALGSMMGRGICNRSSALLRSAGWALILAASWDVAVIALLASSSLAVSVGSPRHLLVLLLPVGVGAALKGVLFPIVHHLGTDGTEGRVGRSVSRVYLGNVLGSTLGPIVTGFWLLDRLSVEAVFGLIAMGTASLGIVALSASRLPLRAPAWLAPTTVLVLAAWSSLVPPAILERIAAAGRSNVRIGHLVQNKHGVIHVESEDKPGTGDLTMGGNIYDGRINTDLSSNANFLERAYVMATIHPHPRSALLVGLSSGAWASVILGIPGLESLDIVEINPGYIEIIKSYPQVAPVLSDPRVRIHIDDGRRWLRAHPDARFDLVFQNTSFYWRAYMTLLLSREYWIEVRRHLNDGGIAAANTTSSLDVYRTASTVFRHVARYGNFMYGSDGDLVKRADAEAVLRRCTVWGRPAFDDRMFERGAIGDLLARQPLEPAEAYLRRAAGARKPQVISDLLLVSEYRHGDNPPFHWMRWLLPSDAGPWPP